MVVIAQLMVVLDASIVTIALPSAQQALHISVANRQWVITAYTLAFGGLLLLGGRIADFGGRKRMFVVGLIGFAAASALGGLAQDQAMLFGARALQGAFAALMAPAALSILTITFQSDPKERAKAFGAYGAVSGAGGAIGVLPGGVLTEYASWRWCLLVNVPIALLAASPPSGWCTRAGPKAPPATTCRGPPVHRRPGQPGLRLHQGGVDGWGVHPPRGPPDRGGRPAGWPSWSPSPGRAIPSPPSGGRRTQPGRGYLASLLTGAGLFAMFVFLSYYLQRCSLLGPEGRIRLPPFAAGIILAAGASSSLVPRIGPRVPMAVGLLVGAVGLAWLSQIGVTRRTGPMSSPRSSS